MMSAIRIKSESGLSVSTDTTRRRIKDRDKLDYIYKKKQLGLKYHLKFTRIQWACKHMSHGPQ